MTTILDSLVVELGLDPTKLNKGQQQALASFKKTQEEALKSGKAIEGAAQRVTQYLGSMRNQAVGFAAAAFGASGIVDFIKQVTTSNAALDRSAKILGTSTEALSVWRGAVKLAGGTAEGLNGFVSNLVGSFSAFGIGGPLPESTKYFRQLGIAVYDLTTKKLRPFQDILIDISKELERQVEDPVEKAAFARGMGVPEDMIPFIIKGESAIRGYVAEMEKVAKVNADAAAKSAEFEQSLTRIGEGAKGAGNKVVTGVMPALKFFTDFWGRTLGDINTMLEKIGGGKSGASDLRTNGRAGTASVGVQALASSLQNSVPNLKEFTSFDDTFHKGRKSKHNEGLALDFTVKDPSKYAETAAAVRQKLAAMGIDAYVRDEKNNPSPGSTGDHIHVAFANKGQADKFIAMTGGAGAAAMSNASVTGGGGDRSVVINGGIHVTVPNATNATVTDKIFEQIERRSQAFNAETRWG